jgi:TonB-linked SusC/RagA family outer membrane protein
MKKMKFFKKAILSLVLILSVSFWTYAQNREITGKVIDEGGLPLPGVSVVIKGTTTGTVTGVDGNYSLSGVSPDATIVFSFIGMKTEEIAVGNQVTINVTLQAEAYSLAEVVAIGYGTQKKANLTGAVDMVTAEKLETRPITNVSEGLQGLIPNLNVTIFSGDPSQSTDLNVRGFESINGGNPLVLVDGVPMDLNRVNPQDIQSITVLKDAAAGAVYGARAAFGVILVETKRGEGPINIRFSTEQSFDKPIYNWEPLEDGYEYAQIRNAARERDGGQPEYSQEFMDGLRRYWQEDGPPWEIIDGSFTNYAYSNIGEDLLTSFSRKQKYDLSISGSSENARYYTSFGYVNTDGFLNSPGNDNFKRYNILMKGDFQATDWLKVDQQITITSQRSDQPTNLLGGQGRGNLIAIMRSEPFRPHVIPFIPEYPEIEGDYWEHGLTYYPELERGGRTKWSNQDTWLKTGVTIDLFEGMQVKSDFTYQLFNRLYESAEPMYHTIAQDLSEGPYQVLNGDNEIETDTRNNEYYVFNVYGQYQRTFGKHYVNTLVGFNQEWGNIIRITSSAFDLVSPNIINIGSTTGEQRADGRKAHHSLRGSFFRLNYIFDDKYLFEANGRYDGTSRFPEDDRFGFFPSFSAAWRIANENFMDFSRAIFDDIKIRASYGTLGNQLLGSNYYPYIPSMGVFTERGTLGSGPISSVRMPGLVSPSLSWETVVSQNLGLDLTLLNQKMVLAFDTYIRETKNMLMRRQYPMILGTGAPDENAADLETRGWEFSLNWRDNPLPDFSYDLGFSIADWKAEITKFENPTNSLATYYVGQRIGEIWGYETVGIIQNEEQLAQIADQSRLGPNWRVGDIEFRDQNDDDIISNGENTLDDPGDQIVIGNENPRYSFGFNANFRYKSFSVATFFQGIGKRDYMPDGGANWTWFYPLRSYGLTKDNISDSWTPENPDAYWPEMQFSTKNWQPQTRYLQNAAYVRLKSLTISYDIPISLMQKFGIKDTKLYVSGQNLWEYSKIRKPLDPEYIFDSRANYPLFRTYSVGVIINL